MKKTTRIIYRKGNSLGNQYAPKNCTGYGTKWKIHVWMKKTGSFGQWPVMGCPILLDANVSLTDTVMKKIEKSNRFFEYFDMGVIY